MVEMRGWRSTAAAVTVACVLAACASKVRAPAPVEDRSSGARAPFVAIEPAKQLPGSENANKPGYYTVRPGDTLVRIALDAGQNWRDIARWNNVDNPNVIEVGQVLRVIPPVAPGVATAAAAAAGAPASRGVPPPAGAASAP